MPVLSNDDYNHFDTLFVDGVRNVRANSPAFDTVDNRIVRVIRGYF